MKDRTEALYRDKHEALRAGWRVLRAHAKRYARPITMLSVLAVLAALVEGVIPFVVGRLIDALNVLPTDGANPEALALAGLFVAVWAILHLGSALVSYVIALRNNHLRIYGRLRYIAEGMAHILRLPIGFHKNHKTGAVVEIVNEGSLSLTQLIATYLVEISPAILTTIVGLAICFWVNVSLALVLFTGIVVFVILLAQITPQTIATNTELRRVRSEAIGYGHDVVLNIHAVKHSAAEAYEEKRLRKRVVEHSAGVWERLQAAFARRSFMLTAIITLTQVTIFALSISLLTRGALSIGELIMFTGYANMVFWPFSRFGNQWGDIQDHLVSAANAGAIMETQEENYTQAGRKQSLGRGRPASGRNPAIGGGKAAFSKISADAPAVSFENVSFSYKAGDPIVLDRISLSVRQGEKVALVGESGVGKSTLVDLISRYYLATAGTVSVFGEDVNTMPLAILRSHIAVVPQEISLFNATVKENIAYGTFTASEGAITCAAKEARAHDFIKRFPQKYDTMVGNRGVKLSVGQKQRIAIARAMLRDPKILILDEPTSALDSQTEREIAESLERLMEGRTTFIIAHRLSTVRKADRIFVVEKGKIVEEGSHVELVAKPHGRYRKLYELHIGLHE